VGTFREIGHLIPFGNIVVSFVVIARHKIPDVDQYMTETEDVLYGLIIEKIQLLATSSL
jgi:hypothetical protein